MDKIIRVVFAPWMSPGDRVRLAADAVKEKSREMGLSGMTHAHVALARSGRDYAEYIIGHRVNAQLLNSGKTGAKTPEEWLSQS